MAHAPIPYDMVLDALTGVAEAYIGAGMRGPQQHSARRHLRTTANDWDRLMTVQIERDWWPLWPRSSQMTFLADMGILQRWYNDYTLQDPLTAKMVDPLSKGCSKTLYRMARSCNRLGYLVLQMTHALDSHGEDPLAAVQWFRGKVLVHMTVEEFDAQNEMRRAGVVTDFYRLLVDIRERRPAPDDFSYFPHLSLVLQIVEDAHADSCAHQAAHALLGLPGGIPHGERTYWGEDKAADLLLGLSDEPEQGRAERSLAHGRARLGERQRRVYRQAWAGA
ncbi:hypothetical protein JCM10450v2_008384 [Rhodotorula kratochvilovae]